MDDAGDITRIASSPECDPQHDPARIKDVDRDHSARDDARKHELCVMMNPGNFPGL